MQYKFKIVKNKYNKFANKLTSPILIFHRCYLILKYWPIMW
jgi:hypothetical protein